MIRASYVELGTMPQQIYRLVGRLGAINPQTSWFLPENIRFMLPLVAFSERGIRPEFTLPLARLVVKSFGVAGELEVNARALADLLVREGIAEGLIEPTPLFEEMYWGLVEGEIARFSCEQAKGLNKFSKELLKAGLPETERYQILIDGVKQFLGLDEVRGYQVSLSTGTWQQFMASDNETISSRFKDNPGRPGLREEKSFLLRLLRGEVSAQHMERNRRNYQYQEFFGWSLLHIFDRKSCSFLDQERIRQDEQVYGEGKTGEVLYLVLRDPADQDKVKVFQANNWPSGRAIFINQSEDFPTLSLFMSIVDLADRNNQLLRKMEELAMTDPLTGLYNRRYFEERLSFELKRASRLDYPLSFVMIDIDFFKRLNDKYGHPFGDLVLRKVAQTIKEQVREMDTVARYGGEEIAIILPGANSHGTNAALVAERIRKAVEALSFPFGDQWVKVTVSIGISAASSSRAEELWQNLNVAVGLENFPLLREADDALYRAKEEGRNRVVIFT